MPNLAFKGLNLLEFVDKIRIHTNSTVEVGVCNSKFK